MSRQFHQSKLGSSTTYESYTPPKPKPIEYKVGTGKLILTQNLLNEIEYHHQKVGGIEWCGYVLYSLESGDLDDPKNFVLKADKMCLMDIGRETFTSRDMDDLDVITRFEKIPGADTLRQGMLHTHHKMSVFFSGTDMQEIYDNVGDYNYYLSLIVNFGPISEWKAKVFYEAEITTGLKFQSVTDEIKDTPSTKKVLAFIDMEIEVEKPEIVVGDYIEERYKEVKKQKEEEAAKSYERKYGIGQKPAFKFQSDQGSLFSKDDYAMMADPFYWDDGISSGTGSKGDIVKDKETFEDKFVQYILEIEELLPGPGLKLSPEITSLDAYCNGIEAYWVELHELAYKKGDEQVAKIKALYDNFVDLAANKIDEVFIKFSPEVIRRKGCAMLEEYDSNGNSIMSDIYNCFDSYVEYAKIMMQGVKEQQEKK